MFFFVTVLNVTSSLLFHYCSVFLGLGIEESGIHWIQHHQITLAGVSIAAYFYISDLKMPIRTRNDTRVAECK